MKYKIEAEAAPGTRRIKKRWALYCRTDDNYRVFFDYIWVIEIFSETFERWVATNCYVRPEAASYRMKQIKEVEEED